MNDSFIIGDAGGSGTQWRVVKKDNIQQFETIGFNAYTHSINDLKISISETFGNKISKEMPIYFYAAGVDTTHRAEEVKKEFKKVFGNKVRVENDLLGVARGLCGKEEGNVCIIGTGSNACFYDGGKVNKVSASLGYVLGDEGSGAYLGKQLLTGVFRSHFSNEIVDAFEETYKLSSHDAINRIYNENQPNHFLASFAPFIHKHRMHHEIYDLIIRSFNDFFDAFFKKSPHQDKPFYFSGSIAYYFSDLLREVGNGRGIHIGNIVQSPIAGLVLYHQQYD